MTIDWLSRPQHQQKNDVGTSTGIRRSVRSFLKKDVTNDELVLVLDRARFAPSGGNAQPWNVHVLREKTIQHVFSSVKEFIEIEGSRSNGDYVYYPKIEFSPYAERIHQSGRDIHDALGIGRRDTQAIRQQKMKNFNFFGAPVGLIITVDRRLELGSWLDVGVFIGYMCQIITNCGLASCVQASFSSYGDSIRQVLGINDNNLIV